MKHHHQVFLNKFPVKEWRKGDIKMKLLVSWKCSKKKTDEPDEVLQKVLLPPKGVMLWSKRSIRIFHKRSKEDIVYIYATGSILKTAKTKWGSFLCVWAGGQKPKEWLLSFSCCYVCDLWPHNGLYPLFSQFFSDRSCKTIWGKKNISPLMVICDGSMVLLQATSMAFCKTNRNALLHSYYNVLTGKGTSQDFSHPILHHCLSHIMKNAKTLCKKQ